MPPATTRAAAREQLLRHFTETLRVLPTELSLALRHPDLPKAGFHHGVNLPWDESDPDNLLEFLDVRYWVVGTTPETSDRYFDLVMRAWEERGWAPQSDRNARPRNGYVRTSDGYGLTVTQSVNGYLSMAGSTPSFTPDSDEAEPFPARIDRLTTA